MQGPVRIKADRNYAFQKRAMVFLNVYIYLTVVVHENEFRARG